MKEQDEKSEDHSIRMYPLGTLISLGRLENWGKNFALILFTASLLFVLLPMDLYHH